MTDVFTISAPLKLGDHGPQVRLLQELLCLALAVPYPARVDDRPLPPMRIVDMKREMLKASDEVDCPPGMLRAVRIGGDQDAFIPDFDLLCEELAPLGIYRA